jgi:ferritin-like metal-binding protein YciE
MKTLQDLFLDSLADVYYAENQLVQALPKMAKAANDAELREAFESHLLETEGHVKKVESVFATLGQKPRAKKCEAIVGLLEEGDEMAAENKGSPALDAALIAAGQKVEHYEIASYGSLEEWAGLLGHDEAAEILDEILNEEKKADTTLTDIARNRCNVAASHPKGNGGGAEEHASASRGRSRRSTASKASMEGDDDVSEQDQN